MFDSLLKSKQRRAFFDVRLTIETLTDIPLVHGRLFVKWKCISGSNDVKGVTDVTEINQDHAAVWKQVFPFEGILSIGGDGVLIPCPVVFKIKQETRDGQQAETIGIVRVNLAEYAGCSEEDTRRYLLQESKINSTLKVTVCMKQTGGDTLYKIPEHDGLFQTYGGIKNMLERGKEHGSNQEFNANLPLQDTSLSDMMYSSYEDHNPVELIEEIFKGNINASNYKTMAKQDRDHRRSSNRCNR